MKTLKDLTSNILSGNLTESGQSFKKVLAEKVASRLYEKKKGRYDKDLDKNKNGKLDKDDFKILRGEKNHCCSEEVGELDEVVRVIDKTRSKYDRNYGKKDDTFQSKMERLHLAKGAKDRRNVTAGSGVSGFNSKMIKKPSDQDTGRIRAVKTNEELESNLLEVLDPSMGVKAYIDDFIKSDDSRFEGDTKEQRRKRAIAAFYTDQKK